MWTAIVGGVTALIKALATWIGLKRDREMVDRGRKEQQADQLQESLAAEKRMADARAKPQDVEDDLSKGKF